MFSLLGIVFQRHEIILRYFRQRKALSPETAILLDKNLLSKGISKEDLRGLSSYVKSTPDGKYWLDEAKVPTTKSLLVILLITFIVVFGVIYILMNTL